MNARHAVILEPFKTAVRAAALPPPGPAPAELLPIGHERGRLWRLPAGLDAEKASLACVARYGLGASVRAGLTLGRSAAVLGLGVIGQFALRCLRAAGAHPLVGIDAVA